MAENSTVRTLTIQNLNVVYPNGLRALDDINLEIPFATITALVGVNGSGKSTLFKSLMGIIKYRKGVIKIDGRPISEALKHNMISYVPQSGDIDWNFPVRVQDVVMMGRYGLQGLRRRPRLVDNKAVEVALERVGLDRLAKRQIGELSGGQRKRVFIARALAQNADIILLDEPFAGVDVTTENAIIAILCDLCRTGRLLLISTHNLGSVPDFCNHTILIKNKILASGPTKKVFSRANLEQAFGGVLRHFVLGGSELHEDEDRRQVTVISDDERPFVIYDEKEKNE